MLAKIPEFKQKTKRKTDNSLYTAYFFYYCRQYAIMQVSITQHPLHNFNLNQLVYWLLNLY